MKRQQWIISIGIAFVLFIAIPVIAQNTPFTDINGNTHEQAIEVLYNEEIIFGTSKTKYEPNKVATRGETAQMFVNALQLDVSNVQDPKFTDVPKTHKYYTAIAALENAGIVSGNDGKFMPNANFKRTHAAKMLTLGFELDMASTLDNDFTDLPEHYATALYIQTLVNYNITQGTSPTTFSPNNPLTRGHVATFLYRTMNVLQDDLHIKTVE